MRRIRGRRVAMVVMGAGLLVLGVLAGILVHRGEVARWLSWARPSRRLPVRAGARKATIAPGAIRLSDFAQFLEEYTGLPVVVDSRIAKDPVEIPTPIHEVDAEIVRAVLEESGYCVAVDSLPGGTREVLRVRRISDE